LTSNPPAKQAEDCIERSLHGDINRIPVQSKSVNSKSG
jgi:hypothetical protein